MLCNKVTTKISELQRFFTSDEKIFQTLLSAFNTLNLSGNQFRTVAKSNRCVEKSIAPQKKI
jgi:hypothetical protein